MTKKTISPGSPPLTWDKFRLAVSDINDNFTEVYNFDIPASIADLGVPNGTSINDVIGWDPVAEEWTSTTVAVVGGTDTIDTVLTRGNTTTRNLTVGDLSINTLNFPDSSQQSTAWTGTVNWSIITGAPTIPTNTNQLTNGAGFITSSSLTWTNVTGKPTFATVATSGAYADLSGKPSLATVATSGSYSDLSGKPSLATVATSGSYSDLSGKPSIPTSILNLGITDGTAGQVLTTNGSGGFSFTTVTGGGGGTGLGSRVPSGGTTASLANNATGNITITGYKTYMMYRVNTNAAAWVRFYITDAARTADSSRSQGTDPSAGAGVIAEVITSGSETVILSPGVLGYNDDATPSTNIYVAVTNLSGSTRTITVTTTLLQLES
jgi:hypothetical protein